MAKKQDRYAELRPWVTGRKVLHLGCVQHMADRACAGDWIHRSISKDAGHVLGIDILDGEIQRLRQMGFNVSAGNAENLELKDKYDVVFAGEIIEHMEDHRGFLESCKRHMGSESRLIITTPNSFGIAYFAARYLGKKFINREHSCWFDETTIRQLLERHDLQVIHFKYLPLHSSNLSRIQNTLLRLIETLFPRRFSATLFLVAQLGKSSGSTEKLKICAVIPAFNEGKTIGSIVRQTRSHVDTVYVVNNGSTDNTADEARKNGASVIDYSEKRGYGASQYAGQQTALKAGFDYILQLDADGQHNPASIPDLINAAGTRQYDIIIGSRFIGKNRENLSKVRKTGIAFFSRVVSFLGGTRVTDVTSGFKIYRASTLMRLSKPSDINPAIEQMLEIAKKGMTIKEVEIEMLGRLSGNSHLNFTRFAVYPLRAVWLIVKVLLFK